MAAARRRRPTRVGLSIRRGTARDAGVICDLIRGLARYERLERQCVIGPAAIRRHGFRRRPYFETLICRRDGRAVGLALYFFTYSTFLGQPTSTSKTSSCCRGPGGRRRPRAATRAGADCGAARLRAHGMGGARLEHAVDPLLPPARRRLQKGVDPHAPHRRNPCADSRAAGHRGATRLGGALRTLGV